jgi:hypothetical protein
MTMTKIDYCGPWVCPYPPAEAHSPGDRWTCPNCGTRYKLNKPKPWRWWRNWAAPHGHWRLSR